MGLSGQPPPVPWNGLGGVLITSRCSASVIQEFIVMQILFPSHWTVPLMETGWKGNKGFSCCFFSQPVNCHFFVAYRILNGRAPLSLGPAVLTRVSSGLLRCSPLGGSH